MHRHSAKKAYRRWNLLISESFLIWKRNTRPRWSGCLTRKKRLWPKRLRYVWNVRMQVTCTIKKLSRSQATLQALESMRKAHQNEVQREVNRFKQEFLRKFNSENQEQVESLAAYKEEKELEEVRQEILSLSEKYSQKCVEAISLEEKLRNSKQKLRHAQQVIQNYEMKSRNLRINHDDIDHEADPLNRLSDDVS